MKGDVDARVHIYTAMALGSEREREWLVLHLAAFNPRETLQYSFYRRMNGPQDQFGHEGVNKNFHPGSNLGHPTHSQVPCCLSYLYLAHIK